MMFMLLRFLLAAYATQDWQCWNHLTINLLHEGLPVLNIEVQQ